MFKALTGRFDRGLFSFIFIWTLLITFVLVSYFWRLGTLTSGLGPLEAVSRAANQSLHNIISLPINAPYRLVQHLFINIDEANLHLLRFSSVIFGLIFIFCFYRLAVSWFGRPIGAFGTLLFGSLPLFVVSTRQATSTIMWFSTIVLMWGYVWLGKSDSNKYLSWIFLIVSAGLLAYTPGIIWLVVGGAIICHRRLSNSISELPGLFNGLCAILFALLVTPLVVSLVHFPSQIKILFLIPQSFMGFIDSLQSIGWMLLSLFVKTPYSNHLIVDRLPLLNVLLIALLIFGVYAMQGVARIKSVLLGSTVLFAVTAAGLNQNLALLSLGLPAVALFISAGLRYLYIEWRSIFPRNPVPKTFALVLIAAVVVAQMYFGLRYALAAWPNTVATKTTYVLK